MIEYSVTELTNTQLNDLLHQFGETIPALDEDEMENNISQMVKATLAKTMQSIESDAQSKVSKKRIEKEAKLCHYLLEYLKRMTQFDEQMANFVRFIDN